MFRLRNVPLKTNETAKILNENRSLLKDYNVKALKDKIIKESIRAA